MDVLPKGTAAPSETRTASSTSPPRGSAPVGDAPEVASASTIGRFVVLETLGNGGMGVVISAYDPTLDRKVAIKLLHGDRLFGPETRGRAQLTAEAQAMARLSHPAVIPVHEIMVDRGTAFLVMEYIPGPTLRGWLAAAERPWREVLAMFLGAGDGLVAAHRAGIVHRDFKPENVLVDRDGRARVGDFGLAAMVAEDRRVVGSGHLAGTLRYMAPEQLRGEACDARADQFAFCVALWEGLHGNRPFAGTTVEELGAAIAERRMSAPLRTAPEWVRVALLRGLSADPAARWPSMSALLELLRRDPGVLRRRIAGGIALAALAGGALWAAWPSRAIDPCTGATARLAGVWDGPRKAQVQAAFAATRAVYAEETWRRVSERLDHYASDWAAMSEDACRATRVEGRQSDTLMDLRMACLDRRRAVLGGLTELWAGGMDAETLAAASAAAGDLPPLADCANARTLAERVAMPSDLAQVATIAAARAQVDAAQALTLAHRWKQGREQARAARAQADATRWPAVRAEAAFAEGDVLSDLSDPSGETALLEAARLASEARDDLLAARALTTLVKSLGVDAQSAPRALLAADIAEGTIARAGDDAGLRALLQRNRAEALLVAGKYDDARTVFTAALAAYSAAFGPDDSGTLWIHTELARLAGLQGDFATARKLGEANLARMVRALGPDDPSVGSTLNVLGWTFKEVGDYDAAAAYLRRALAIKEQVGGDGAWTANTLNNLGIVEMFRGNLAEAESLHERAFAMRTRVLPPDNPLIGASLANLAEVRRKQGRLDEALELLHRAVAIDIKAYGELHPEVAAYISWIGDVLDDKGDRSGALDAYRRSLELNKKARGTTHTETLYGAVLVGAELVKLQRCRDARPLVSEALGGLEKSAGPDHIYVGEALDQLAECDLAEGHAAGAVERLERATAIAEKVRGETLDRGRYRWLLARALWALGRRDAAIAAAQQSEQDLATDPDGARARAAARAWLAAHRPARP